MFSLDLFADRSVMDWISIALDFIILYTVIYRLLLLIRGTQAIQILSGLLVVGGLYIFSLPHFFDLVTIHWMLEKLMASSLLVLIILFQDDIRRALSHMAKRPFFDKHVPTVNQNYGLDQVIKASDWLSQHRIGALIVFERTAVLEDYLKGIDMDALITKELIISIFIPYKSNPTHDGAMYIKKGRIRAAGCFLPLSTNPEIEQMLGTRHRAALGLSEITDAVIIVVSEETGAMSLVFKNKIQRGLSPTELRVLVQKYMSSTPTSEYRN